MADYVEEVYKAVLSYDKDSVVSKVKEGIWAG